MYINGTIMSTTTIVKGDIDRVQNSSSGSSSRIISGNSNSSIGSVMVSRYTDSNAPSVPTSSIMDISEFDSGDNPSEEELYV